MPQDLLWVDGYIPHSERSRNLALSRAKSHAAKLSYRKRVAKNEVITREGQAERTLPPTPFSTPPRPAYLELYFQKPQKARRAVSEEKSLPASTQETDDSQQDREKHLGTDTLITPQHQNNILPIFDDVEELRAFQFWMERASAVMVQCSPAHEDVYTKIIPRLALTSRMVRRMLVASSLVHHHICTNPLGVQDYPAKALTAYSQGCRDMALENPSIELIAASVLGFTYEHFSNNASAFCMHLSGWEAVCLNFLGTRDQEFELMEANHRSMKLTLDLMQYEALNAKTCSKPSRKSRSWIFTQAFSTSKEAREIITCMIESINSPVGRLNMHEMKLLLSSWFNTLRESDMLTPIERDSLHWLYQIARALTIEPQYKQALLRYVAEGAIRCLSNARLGKKKLNVETLLNSRLALRYVIRLSDDTELVKQAVNLLLFPDTMTPNDVGL